MEEIRKYKILIVEDDLFSANYLRSVLQKNNYEIVNIVTKGHDALKAAIHYKPDLILMDIMLGDNMSGTEAAVHITRADPSICIIFITAFTDPEMLEQAIEANTFGYLLKPYNEEQILASVKIALAKTKTPISDAPVKQNDNILCSSDGSLIYNKTKKQLYRHGNEVELGPQGARLMEILCANINHTVSKEQICMHVWNELKNDITIRTLVHRIRLKIGNDIIKSVNGFGYKIRTH